MRSTKKHGIIIGCLLAVLVPLAVLAVIYLSGQRQNNFRPATLDIQVQEDGGSPGSLQDEQQKTYVLPETADENGEYTVEKQVAVRDTRTHAGEMLRVCFVPVWYDGAGNVSGGVFNTGNCAMNAAQTAIVYRDGDKIMTLELEDGWQSSGWEYRSDGSFCYSGELGSQKLTPPLLRRVVLNEGAYEKTEAYTLRIEVLADAVQITDDAADIRGWEPPSP